MSWFAQLERALREFEGRVSDAEDYIARASKVWLIGNGGSAAICSHIATDYTKNANIPAQAFNDASLLTCYANDFGWDQVFAKAIEYKVFEGDLVIAISSSGRSKNILNGVEMATDIGADVITLSGFDANNPLRATGDLAFYVPSHDYGIVEITHLAILHSMVGM